ncbi:hypothetical protein [Bradyrhizobium sp. CCGB01]|uniref:hypothetical protein n=1 Tax=Bradyrhizobium sp. CCGB01 TaxID=2949634 RepID=UPI0020B25C7F|nr:hypothetical protein [Bradyrhizobium sp. CCGB01]MCP3405397.1 hypothetical protein [Bradyrhizobium sp. CCGB01]
MINLSSGRTNEDGIFLHADVKAERVRALGLATGTKSAKTTPCTVAGAWEINDLRIIRSRFDSSGKTGA